MNNNSNEVYLFIEYTSPVMDPNYMDYTYIIKKLSDTGKCKIHKDVIKAYTTQVFITAPREVIEEYNNKYSYNLFLFETDFIKNKHEKL
jgi:hypothetical protein